MDLSIRAVFEGETDAVTENQFVFKPTEQECQNGLISICYSSAKDEYIRKSSCGEQLNPWSVCTYSCINFFRKPEYDWRMTYLARDSHKPFAAEVSWKFDVTGTDRKMSVLELKAPCALYEDGVIIWTICTDKRNFVQTDVSLNEFVTFELDGSTTLTLTAFLTGGRGSCAYQHAQLFRQNMSDSNFPFEVKLFLESPTSGLGQSMVGKASPGEVKNYYIFMPNESERKAKTIDISYDPSEDCYHRNASDEMLPSWNEFTYSYANMHRVENDYLATKDSSQFGKVTWKFDVTAAGLRLKLMRLRAPTEVPVIWVICSGNQCYMETGDALHRYMTFELEGATDLSITVFLGEGTTEKIGMFDLQLTLEEMSGMETDTTGQEYERMDTSNEIVQESSTGFTFKPTEGEIAKKAMHVCYSTKDDAYIRKTSSGELLNSWENYTKSQSNLFRKQDDIKWETYLISEDSYQQAEVSWKFDVTDTDLKMSKLDLRASTVVSESGSVQWTITAGQHDYKVASLQELKTFDLHNSTTLTISARLQGNQASNAWEHSQLFPQNLDDVDNLPFEVKLSLAHPAVSKTASIDASEWRFPRDSFGIPADVCTKVDKSFVFKPTKLECENKLMDISYSSASNSYKRNLSPGEGISSWLDGTYSSTNMYRKEETDHDMTYLARIEGTQFAEVTWKFDVTGSGFEMDSLTLTAATALYEDARVLWTIRAGDRTVIKTGACFRKNSSEKFKLEGASTLTITAFLTGGKGLVAWQHSQLFRENMYREDDAPFQVKLYLNETVSHGDIVPWSWKGDFGLPAVTCQQVDKNFVFKPTPAEIESGQMHIVYCIKQDCYTRKSSNETQSSWLECTNSSTNLAYIKRTGSWGKTQTCLERINGTQFAEVTWKFDVTEHGLNMSKLQLIATHALEWDGCVVWTIKADDQKFIQTCASLTHGMTFDLKGSQTLSLTAFLTGGRGALASQHAQLFYQQSDSNVDLPFKVKLFFEPKNNWTPLDAACVKSDLVEQQYFSFLPSEQEIRAGKMKVRLNLAKNVYSRPSAGELNEVHSWKKNTYSIINMIRVEDRGAGQTYLARKRGSKCAAVTWKFDLRNTPAKMTSLKLKAQINSEHADGCETIAWCIYADTDKQCYYDKGFDLSDSLTFELHGSKTLTITALVRGSTEPDEWNNARALFQDGDEEFPLKVKLTLNSDN